MSETTVCGGDEAMKKKKKTRQKDDAGCDHFEMAYHRMGLSDWYLRMTQEQADAVREFVIKARTGGALLDTFAAAALQGLTANEAFSDLEADVMAKFAWRFAQAMMDERRKRLEAKK